MTTMIYLLCIICCTLFTITLATTTPEQHPKEFIQSTTATPVIGILTQPSYNLTNSETTPSSTTPINYYYIAASYVKWIESGGGRAIPIPYDASPSLVEELFSQVNGVLFPGGGSALSEAARHLWELVLEANSEEEGKGDYVPLWGTCLGFEYMVMLAADAGDSILQSGFDAENISLPLLFTEDDSLKTNQNPSFLRKTPSSTTTKSQLYSNINLPLSTLTTQNLTMNNHHQGITPTQFHSDHSLSSLFHITTTSIDKSGRTFVSTIESSSSNNYPLYGVQYHPEKNAFEYSTFPNTNIPYESINHSKEGVTLSFEMARFFVGRAQVNVERGMHGYTKVRRFPRVQDYERRLGLGFEEIFVIPDASHWEKEDILNKEVGESKHVER
mmetsp:Transcript_12087/g.18053  ORF Transcript_12087/g.18053 Transcript_12087/m.18053 type:complete len:386 (-) Transcript_12087:168-1325(-)